MENKRLLQILEMMKLRYIEEYKDGYIHAGLCDILMYLRYDKDITTDEEDEVKVYLDDNRPNDYKQHLPFYWKKAEDKNRIKWLNKHINKLKSQINEE